MENQQYKRRVKFFWNNQEIEAEENENLLQAVLDNGIHVTHYCHHKGLSAVSACRMCLVKMEGKSSLVFACEESVTENARYNDDIPEVLDAKKDNLMVILNSHLFNCETCDQSGECILQDDYRKFVSSAKEKKISVSKTKKNEKQISENIIFDSSKCILCFRCVRFTREISKTDDLRVVGRGHETKVEYYNELKNNNYSGNLVDVCPVGALTGLDFRYKVPPWLLSEIETSCIACDNCCSIKVSFNDKGIYRVRAPLESSDIKNWICNDGRKVHSHVLNENRLKTFFENRGGHFIGVSEEEIVKKIRFKKAKFILSTFLTKEEYTAFFEEINQVGNTEVALYVLPTHGSENDGVLKRSNRNPNLVGAKNVFDEYCFDHSEQQLHSLLNSLCDNDVLYVVIPELIYDFSHFKEMLKNVVSAGLKIALTSNNEISILKEFNYLAPVHTFLEKNGRMINYKKEEKIIKRGTSFSSDNRGLTHYVRWANCEAYEL